MVDIERVVTLDDLMETVPEDLIRDAETRKQESELKRNDQEESSKMTSKAERIRDYLTENPEAKNKDVAEALSSYGVKAADVANAKSHLKKTGQKLGKRGASSAKPRLEPTAKSTATATDPGPSVNLRELEAGVAFVEAVGSVQRAQHLLIIIGQIRR
jgi:hypothetical protein